MFQQLMQYISKVLSNSEDASSMRVMSFYSVIIGSIVGITGLIMNKDLTDLSILVGVFVGAGFTGKVIQKKIEKKDSTEIDSSNSGA